ncbi:MAG: hypothetical protein ABSC95_12400 [Acetobacteraceae bacterium]
MEAHVGDALVSGYEHLIEQLTLPDRDDRQVLAAAIHGGATVIVTANLRDCNPSGERHHQGGHSSNWDQGRQPAALLNNSESASISDTRSRPSLRGTRSAKGRAPTDWRRF